MITLKGHEVTTRILMFHRHKSKLIFVSASAPQFYGEQLHRTHFPYTHHIPTFCVLLTYRLASRSLSSFLQATKFFLFFLAFVVAVALGNHTKTSVYVWVFFLAVSGCRLIRCCKENKQTSQNHQQVIVRSENVKT